MIIVLPSYQVSEAILSSCPRYLAFHCECQTPTEVKELCFALREDTSKHWLLISILSISRRSAGAVSKISLVLLLGLGSILNDGSNTFSQVTEVLMKLIFHKDKLTKCDSSLLLILSRMLCHRLRLSREVTYYFNILSISTMKRSPAKVSTNSKPNTPKQSSFRNHATRLLQARQKKSQPLTSTKQRLLQSHRSNAFLKVSKRANRFSLLDSATPSLLTHRGVPLSDLQQFNDVEFGSDEEVQQFADAQDLNFAGFEGEGEGKPKTKNEVYKQIIEKSRKYKHLRQEQYEENLEHTTRLDEDFKSLVHCLKFRDSDQKIIEKIKGKGEFENILHEMETEKKVQAVKYVDQTRIKKSQKVKDKKNIQLKKAMESKGEDGNIRDWVQKVRKEKQNSQSQEQQDIQQQEQQQEQQEQEQQQQQQQQQQQECIDQNNSEEQEEEQNSENEDSQE